MFLSTIVVRNKFISPVRRVPAGLKAEQSFGPLPAFKAGCQDPKNVCLLGVLKGSDSQILAPFRHGHGRRWRAPFLA